VSSDEAMEKILSSLHEGQSCFNGRGRDPTYPVPPAQTAIPSLSDFSAHRTEKNAHAVWGMIAIVAF
jgi:hypothetical protein